MSIRFSHALMLIFSTIFMLIYLSEKEIPLENVFKTKSEFRAKTYLYDFSSYRYDESGKLLEVINAEMALDIPISQEIKLMKPSIHTHDENQDTWVASADVGVMHKDNSLVLLKENVLVMNKNTHSKVETSEVNFDLQKRVAETKKQVAVSHVDGYTIADGMKADLKRSKLELHNQVHTTFFNDNE